MFTPPPSIDYSGPAFNPLKKAEVVCDLRTISDETWHNHRRTGIGGSDCAAVHFKSKFKTGRDIFNYKTGVTPIIEYHDANNWLRLQMGHALEDLIAQAYSIQSGYKVIKSHLMYRHPVHKFMIADFDFFIELGRGKYGILDCKSGNSKTQYIWNNDSIPLDYEYQGYHYDIIADGEIDRIVFAALLDNTMDSLVVRELKKDKVNYEKIIAKERFFWNEYVMKNQPPPLHEENPDKLLNHLITYIGYEREDNTVPLTLPEYFVPIVEKCVLLKQQKQENDQKGREIEKEIKLLKAQLCAAMGKAQNAVCKTKTGQEYKIKNYYSESLDLDKAAKERMRSLMPNTYKNYAVPRHTHKFEIEVVK